MPKRRPKGVYARSTPDWFTSKMVGGYVLSPAVAGQVSYCRLFNNCIDGTDLIVYGLNYFPLTNTGLYLEWGRGNEGTLFTDGAFGGWHSIDPRNQGLPGQFYTFSAAACITYTTGFIAAGTLSGGPNYWQHEWPVAVIPPGYSFYFHGDTVNQRVYASAYWANVPAG